MTLEEAAAIAIISGLFTLVALAIYTLELWADGHKYREFERMHGRQDTDEIPIGKVQVGLYTQAQRDRLEDMGGPAKPIPPHNGDV